MCVCARLYARALVRVFAPVCVRVCVYARAGVCARAPACVCVRARAFLTATSGQRAAVAGSRARASYTTPEEPLPSTRRSCRAKTGRDFEKANFKIFLKRF